MKEKRKGDANATPTTTDTKVTYQKDIDKVFEFFRYTTGTTLDCAIATGVLRNSITYYVADLEKMKMLQPVWKSADSTTGRTAKHYSADPAMWVQRGVKQLELFGKEVGYEF